MQRALLKASPPVVTMSLLLGAAGPLFAADQEGGALNTGDTAWMLVSSALVLLMLPGLALFYAGMVRSKNVLATMMHSFVAMALITLQWVLIGYTLAFGPSVSHVIGGPAFAFLNGITPHDLRGSIPTYTFVMFQGMFAIITPALISGALAERIKFSAYVVFILLWATLVYDPIAHWVWGAGGWLGSLGVLDFAGGTVVHLSSGMSALATICVLGRRQGYLTEKIVPHNLGLTLLGAGLLWFGWFGFNAGSALASNGNASVAFTATHVASAAGALSWMLSEWIHRKKPSALGAASGIVAGLVAITPAAGYVSPMSALVIGLIAGLVCYSAVYLKVGIGYDDSLDVFGIHGVGGMLGALATGLFATVNASGALAGNWHQFHLQCVAVAFAGAYAFGATYLIALALDATLGLRVDEEAEMAGLDQTQHGEAGYNLH